MFGLFKNKKKELANEIFGAFKPKIHLAKKIGKWEKTLTFGDVLINDNYLLGFFNTYLGIVSKKFGYSGQDVGLILMDVYKLLDGTYSDLNKFQKVIQNYQFSKSSGSKDLMLGEDHALMFFLVFTSDNAAHKFSKDPIYKEANKYFESGEFKKQSDWAKKVLPKEFSDGNTLSDAPSNIIVAYRIFEQTFEKRLNKVFKIGSLNDR
jgi:hypothetical protein